MKRLYQVTSVHRGDDTRIAKMCKALEGAGHDVTVLALTDGVAVKPEGSWKIQSYGKPSRIRLARLLQQPALWRLLHNAAPHAIQFHDPELLPLMLWLAGSKGRRRKIVYDMHENVAASLRDRGCSEFVARTYEFFLRIAERRLWITLAEDSYRELVDQPWPVIHNYPCAQDVAKQSDRRQAVYIGDVSKMRGAVEMLHAFALAGLKDWKLAIIGPCNEPGTEELLISESRRLGLADRFVRVGAIPPVQVKDCLAASSIGLAVLHPLRNYVACPPGKVFEYALAGLPAIVSDFSHYRNCFGVLPSVSFVDPLDVHAIAKALKRTAENLENLEADCARSREIAALQYSWNSEAIRVGAMFDLLLEAPADCGRERYLAAFVPNRGESIP